MNFLIGLILVLMGIYVEAKPQNPKDGELATRISSKYYQTLQSAVESREIFGKTLESEIADVELGVRLVGWWHKKEHKASLPEEDKFSGRVEIFQDGEWQKLCLNYTSIMLNEDRRADRSKRHLAKVVCGMVGVPGNWKSADMSLLGYYFAAELSGVSKYEYVCTGDEKTIFDCKRQESRCELDPKKEITEYEEERKVFWVAVSCRPEP